MESQTHVARLLLAPNEPRSSHQEALADKKPKASNGADTAESSMVCRLCE